MFWKIYFFHPQSYFNMDEKDLLKYLSIKVKKKYNTESYIFHY
jgi:hypothetical protein